jgi:hypothetical protein
MNKELISLKPLQRGYQANLTVTPTEQFAATIPSWISAMGLEWLHEFLLKIELLLKGKLSR